MEFLLSKEDFYRRVYKKRKERETKLVEIIDYDPQYKMVFRDLNHDWIKKYFQLEETDNISLDNPETKIIQPGGYICFARYHDEIVGTCALIKMDDDTYELAKMAVSENAQGRNIGWLISQHIIQKAKELGAKKLYLESNTKLAPAINLYYKLGFKRIVGPPSPYERANIQMELEL
jgi:GNAT superfamily N-acetyltransferase